MPRNTNRLRPERVAEQIRIEVAEILQRQLKDPRIRPATCTRVTVSGDLRNAKIYVSVLAEPEAQEATLKALHGASGFVRRILAERLGLRAAPEVRFVFDPSVEYGIRLEQLIEETKQEGGSASEAESRTEREPGESER